jgi:DNA-binding response OmpR family regulator
MPNSAPDRVLIASPNPFLLSEYRSALRDGGIDVTLATSGIHCLEQLAASPLDFAVLDSDLLWGGVDGVLAVLAEDPAYPTVPAMVVTSRHSRAALYEAGRFVVADYQLKPLSGTRLLQRIQYLFASPESLERTASQFPDIRSSESRQTVQPISLSRPGLR